VEPLVGFDLQVHGHEMVALVGDNGAGKSTAVKIVSGVLQPDAAVSRAMAFDRVVAFDRFLDRRGDAPLPGAAGAVGPADQVGHTDQEFVSGVQVL
jgi:energy-coupling factor transporter ATP-binding protein EcfA2